MVEKDEERLARTLTNVQRAAARKIIEVAEAEIARTAAGDEDVDFYMRRYVHARLQLTNRGSKQKREKLRRDLFGKQQGRCAICGEAFTEIKGLHLHRVGRGGYSMESAQLVHKECHEKHHLEKGEPMEPSS